MPMNFSVSSGAALPLYGALTEDFTEDLQSRFHTHPLPPGSSYCFNEILFILLKYKTPDIGSFKQNLLLV